MVCGQNLNGCLLQDRSTLFTCFFQWIVLPAVSEHHMQNRIFNQRLIAQAVPQALLNVHLMVPGRKTNKEKKNLTNAVQCIWGELRPVPSLSSHAMHLGWPQITRLNSAHISWKTQLAIVLNWFRTSLALSSVEYKTHRANDSISNDSISVPDWLMSLLLVLLKVHMVGRK